MRRDNFVITDGDGNTLADNTKVINAGVYKITYKLRGGDAGNYELKDGEQTFTVKAGSWLLPLKVSLPVFQITSVSQGVIIIVTVFAESGTS